MSLRRLLQLGIDFLITAILCLIPIGLTGWLLPTNPDGTVRPLPATVGVAMALLTCVALGGLYWVALPSSGVDRLLGGQGRTAGMRVFGLRVVSEDGSRPDVGQFFVRWAGLLIDGIAFGLVGLVSIWVTKRGQRIGDLAAGTVVVSQPRHVTLPHVPEHLPGLPWRREHRVGGEDASDDSSPEPTRRPPEVVAPAPQWRSPTRSTFLSEPSADAAAERRVPTAVVEDVTVSEDEPVEASRGSAGSSDRSSVSEPEDDSPATLTKGTAKRRSAVADDGDDWAEDAGEDDQTPETPDDELPPDSAEVGSPDSTDRPVSTPPRPLPRSTNARTQRPRRRRR